MASTNKRTTKQSNGHLLRFLLKQNNKQNETITIHFGIKLLGNKQPRGFCARGIASMHNGRDTLLPKISTTTNKINKYETINNKRN